MGLGCNAVGVTGCRIIDSPRERLVAVLTNNFMPCNGRFPMLIAILLIFFPAKGAAGSAATAPLLTGLIALGVGATLLISRVLSDTLLKGEASFFALELPPYRVPRVGSVLVRSLLDRTLFVLGRAAAVAAPAGLVIWLLANVRAGDASLLAHASGALDPFARLLGLDGVILLAFILGLPANEIVLPVVLMAYTAQNTLIEPGAPAALTALLTDNGWTWLTAACTMIFCLMHWPCSTTCLTIRRETGSWKWTALAAAIPTLSGILLCALLAGIVRAMGWGA